MLLKQGTLERHVCALCAYDTVFWMQRWHRCYIRKHGKSKLSLGKTRPGGVAYCGLPTAAMKGVSTLHDISLDETRIV